MGMLESIKSGRENKPPRIMVYGQEGVGKSTFGASAPAPIIIQTGKVSEDAARILILSDIL